MEPNQNHHQSNIKPNGMQWGPKEPNGAHMDFNKAERSLMKHTTAQWSPLQPNGAKCGVHANVSKSSLRNAALVTSFRNVASLTW